MLSILYLHSISQSPAGPGDNCDLVNRRRICLHGRYKGMSYFVIRYDKFLLFRQHTALFLIACNNYFDTFLKICLSGKFSPVTDRTQRRFIDYIRKLSSGCSGCSFCNLIKVYIIRNFDLSCMDFQNLLSSLQVRKLYRNSSVKTSGTEERRVKRIRTVGGSQNHYTLGTVKTIHLCEKLVQCLFHFIISSYLSVTLFSDGIDLVDKYNTWSFLICLFE